MLWKQRRDRLQWLLDLIRTMRGWTRGELSTALGRDPTKLVPASGNPKLDLVVGVAAALGWSVGDVVESIWLDRAGEEGLAALPQDPREVAAVVDLARRERRWEDLRAAGVALRLRATHSEERALADHVIASAWAGMGCFATSLSVAQRGLAEPGVGFDLRELLSVDVAAAHYALWNLVEARAIASEILRSLEGREDGDLLRRLVAASARSVRGHASRRLMAVDLRSSARHAAEAIDQLEVAEREFRWLHDDFGDPADLGRAHTCRGGALEARATIDPARGIDLVDSIVAGLDECVDVESFRESEVLESHGWWCIFGCNVALRAPDADRTHRSIAILTNKAFEIADRLDHWAMRERAFTIEHFRRDRAACEVASFEEWVLDPEDLRVVMGTMGRFPGFRPIGWRILLESGVVDE
ncbi:MAG: hypothetical protein FJ257_05795 [Phycisphaerae bacterium]|nr:hypothetical protein [Phycisphaerae bacterium]